MQMKSIIQWCLELGVRVVSVYAFSIDNFKRPPDEVHDLMQLAETSFEELLQVSHSTARHGTAQHSMAWHGMVQHRTAQDGTASHSTD